MYGKFAEQKMLVCYVAEASPALPAANPGVNSMTSVTLDQQVGTTRSGKTVTDTKHNVCTGQSVSGMRANICIRHVWCWLISCPTSQSWYSGAAKHIMLLHSRCTQIGHVH